MFFFSNLLCHKPIMPQDPKFLIFIVNSNRYSVRKKCSYSPYNLILLSLVWTTIITYPSRSTDLHLTVVILSIALICVVGALKEFILVIFINQVVHINKEPNDLSGYDKKPISFYFFFKANFFYYTSVYANTTSTSIFLK